MRPNKLSVHDLFQKQRQYVVPLYQRSYVWNEEEQWRPFWEDVERQADACVTFVTLSCGKGKPTSRVLRWRIIIFTMKSQIMLTAQTLQPSMRKTKYTGCSRPYAPALCLSLSNSKRMMTPR